MYMAAPSHRSASRLVTPEPSEAALPKTPHDRKTKPSEAQKNSPIARSRTVNGTKDSFIGQDAASRYHRYAYEGRKWIVGPMPCQEFTDDFLPPGPPGMPSEKGAFKKVPTSAVSNELVIYAPLIKDINENGRCPTVIFVDTSILSEDSGTGSLKPEVCAFDINELPNIPRVVVDDVPRIPANLGAAELYMEAKLSKHDPFKDPHHTCLYKRENSLVHHFVLPSDEAAKTIGQNVAYAAEVLARQHRLFYISVMIFGNHVRFVRWDRAGAIVSRSFDYKKSPRILCEFLWRFGHASPEQRGYDPSVSLASKAEEEIYRETVRNNIIFQLGLDTTKDTKQIDKEMEDHYEPGKVTKLDVYDEKRRSFEQYIVSRPIKSPISLAGRSTRGYWAARLERDSKAQIAFLKDTWRNDVDGMEKEGDIYDELHENEVPNISDVFCHGDIPDEIEKLREESESESHVVEEVQNNTAEEHISSSIETPLPEAQTTKTDLYADKAWSCTGGRDPLPKHVYKHTHSRLALKNVGFLLKRFRGSRQLFHAASDVVDTIVKANECNRLHRDISIGNILLFRGSDGVLRAILIDWELSTRTGNDGKARDYFRSGTWAYMSIAALKGRNDFRHSVGDDLESIFYCVLYFAVRSLPYYTKRGVYDWMFHFFDEHVADLEGTEKGGITKQYFLSQPEDFTEHFKFDNVNTENWFKTVYSYLTTTLPVARMVNLPLLWEPIKVQELFNSMLKKDLPEDDRIDHAILGKTKGAPFYATSTTRVHPKDITEPAAAESSRIRNKRSRVEINGKHGEPANTNSELRESKKRKGRAATAEKREPTARDGQASRESDAGTLSRRRSARSSTRNALVGSRKR